MLLVDRSAVPSVPEHVYARLRQTFPAALVTQPSPHVSGRYTFAPTFEVLEGFYRHGWQLTNVGGRSLYGKHVLTFAPNGQAPVRPDLGGLTAQAQFLGSHDGTRRTLLAYGVLRLVCRNGLLAPVLGGQVDRRHTGAPIDFAAVTGRDAAESFANMQRVAEDWRQTTLTEELKVSFAHRAFALKEGLDLTETPLSDRQRWLAESRLRVRRPADGGSDVWSTFNRLQEANVTRSPGVASFDANMDLWGLASQVATEARGAN